MMFGTLVPNLVQQIKLFFLAHFFCKNIALIFPFFKKIFFCFFNIAVVFLIDDLVEAVIEVVGDTLGESMYFSQVDIRLLILLTN